MSVPQYGRFVGPSIVSVHAGTGITVISQNDLNCRRGPQTVDGSEIFMFILSGVLALTGIGINRTGSLHRLYFRGNPGPGIIRLGILLAMVWIGYVLWRHGDPSVRGIYVVFYLVMGYAVVKMFGQTVAAAYGARSRVDVAERRNLPAALLIGSFTLATGLIFGGSLWGEADPEGGGEGGWWIPVTFFLLGWGTLLLVFGIFLRREEGRISRRLRRERSLDDARAASFFLLASGATLADASSGDFWGWRHALLTFGVLAGLLVLREVFAAWTDARGRRLRTAYSQRQRIVEAGAYAVMALAAWGLNRVLDGAWGPG